MGFAGWWLTGLLPAASEQNASASATRLSDVAQRSGSKSPESASEAPPVLHPVWVRPGNATPTITLTVPGGVNGSHEVSASCGTCHATRSPDFTNRKPEDLDEFHQGIAFSHSSSHHGADANLHNTLTCLSCHNPNDYDTLRLADGTTVEYVDVMKLCSQCHGPQTRDFEHGAHGGMTGYWDLTRGPRQRNNCVDCHHPHTPQFPKMKPTFKPRDRFLSPTLSDDESPVHGSSAYE